MNGWHLVESAVGRVQGAVGQGVTCLVYMTNQGAEWGWLTGTAKTSSKLEVHRGGALGIKECNNWTSRLLERDRQCNTAFRGKCIGNLAFLAHLSELCYGRQYLFPELKEVH